MPFHPGGRKPVAQTKAQVGLKGRLTLASIGAGLILIAAYYSYHGVEVWPIGRRGGFLSVVGLALSGLVLILFAFIPSRWLNGSRT